jgi:hypothetical protein
MISGQNSLDMIYDVFLTRFMKGGEIIGWWKKKIFFRGCALATTHTTTRRATKTWVASLVFPFHILLVASEFALLG